MFELIEGEFLKLKRSRMFTITLLGSLVPAILLLVMMIKIESTFTYSLLFEQSLEYVTLLFGFYYTYYLLHTYSIENTQNIPLKL